MSLDLISALAAYIPRDRVEHIINPSFTIPRDGVALIADISGFTPLTEALTKGLRPDQGAEELTKALDAVFTPLIADMHTYRGSVIKFGGDALIAWFGRTKGEHRKTVIRRAVTAAARMQNAMAVHGQIPTPIGIITLRMKIGLAYGSVKRFNLGLEQFGYEDVIAGLTMDRMAAAEQHAKPGDIMTDQETAALVPHLFTTAEINDGYIAIGKIKKPALPTSWPNLSVAPNRKSAVIEQLATYVPQQIKERLMIGQKQVAELKSVSSLFMQFHGLDFDHDPQILDRLQTYFAKAQEVVSWYGGRLNRLITGDKGNLIHIIFGAPLTVEEQEKRAVRCALDLQKECGLLPFIAMQRIGLTTGRVFAGPVGGPMRHDYTTMGDSINLSARLMQNAADSQVLFDDTVSQQLDHTFSITDLGKIKVKGKAAPVHVFTATKATTQTRRIRTQQLQPIFGRTQELAQLRRMIGALETGKGQIAILVGDVGMGKTLILDTLRVETERRWQRMAKQAPHGRWLSGMSLAYGQTLSGYLFIDLLRDLLELPADASPSQTSAHLLTLCTQLFGENKVDAAYPYLAQFMGLPLEREWADRLTGLAGESLRWQLFNIIPSLFARLSLSSPILISLDDLQWSDPTSVQLIQTLIPLTRTNPLFLLLSMRPTDAPRIMALADHLQRFDTLPATMTLTRLTEPEAQLLITDHAPQLPAEIRPQLIEKGGGSPLFLVELLRTLEAQGVLSANSDLTELDIAALDIPNSVQGLLLAQIDRLTTEARHTLQMAAVIGKNFLYKVLSQLATAEQALDEQIMALEDNQFIQEIGITNLGREHTFRHILIQESAYNTLLYERRRIYHEQVAHALETLFPMQIGEQAGMLAHHYEQAGNLKKAIAFYQQTADQARLLYANEEAADLYTNVLNLLNQQEEQRGLTLTLREQRAKTYLKIAQLHANQMDFSAAQEYYGRAFTLLEQLDHASKRAQKTRLYKRPLRWGVLPDYTSTFDPAFATNLENAQIVRNLFEGLVEIDNEWNILPALAKRWHVSDDGLTYEFTLREGLQWSDGQPLTAADFVFAWQRNLSPQLHSPLAYMLYPIRGATEFHSGQNPHPNSVCIVATDSLTLRIELNQSSHYFLYLLAHPITCPQPYHAWQEERQPIPHEKLISNGPFYIDEPPPDDSGIIKLSHNPHYHGFETGSLTTVQLIPIHPTIEHYHADKIDWCRIDDEHPPTNQTMETESFIVQDLITYFLGFASHIPPFNQTLVRQAFAAAIDKQVMIQTVWSNIQKIANGGIIPSGIAGHSPEIDIPFDPQQAQDWLQKAGFPNGKNLPKLKMAALPGFKTTPQFLQTSWVNHLSVQIELVEFDTVDEAITAFQEGEVQLMLSGLGLDYPDPEDILRALAYSNSPFNDGKWSNSLYDQMLDQAQTSASYQERLELYHQADTLLVNQETGLVPLHYLQSFGLLNPRFQLNNVGKIVRPGGLKLKHISIK